MFETLTESQLDTITGGAADESLPSTNTGRALSAPLSLGSRVKPVGEAMTQKKLPIFITGSAS